MHVLILDDEAAIGRVISRLARVAGFSAQAVTKPGEFQSQYRLSPPNVVLLDLQLGGDDGQAQLRFLADQGYPHAVILMSGYDQRVLSSAERMGRDLGLDILGTIGKPFRAEDVSEMFDRLAGRFAPSPEDASR